MASGIAPVAAEVGGAKEIIENGCSGLFAEPLNSDDMMKKIEWLLDHSKYRKEIAAQAHLRAQHYRWDAILTRLFENYENVIEIFRYRRDLKKAA
jgi:glycosyltransferase involved in cell wall biosynthesis